MALDAATLALTAAELKAMLTDAKIAKLFEPTRDELVLTLRTRTDTYALLLSDVYKRQVQGELVVLDVVAAHQDLKAIGGSEPQEVCRLLALIPLLVVFRCV